MVILAIILSKNYYWYCEVFNFNEKLIICEIKQRWVAQELQMTESFELIIS